MNQPGTDRYSVPASSYTIDELAELYNLTRIDYIVPMPMNGRRLGEYMRHYDVNLNASMVTFNSEGLESGLVMLGLRDQRAWITRLGVIPERRGHKIGQFLMERAMKQAKTYAVEQIQLEVIVGNMPAYNLFVKLGFAPTRELLVVRRAPAKVATNTPPIQQSVELTMEQILACLQAREPGAAWTEETRSLLQAGGLKGYSVYLASGESGWIICQHMPYQLTHIVISPNASDELAQALLYTLHTKHPMHDTKLENLPTTHPTWVALQHLGYVEEFRRIEMVYDAR